MTIERRTALVGLAAAMTGWSGRADAATAVITGTVTYRERIPLPRGARLTVELVDVSLADAPSRTLVATTVRPRGIPIPYRMSIDRARILPGRSYALQARIEAGGRLWFTTTTRHNAFGGGPDMTEIVVQRVASEPKAEADGPHGNWLAQRISGRQVEGRVRSTLSIAPDGSVGGRGGCNGFGGRATIRGGDISFVNLNSTLMACSDRAAMTQEQRFFAALQGTRKWRVDGAGRQLTLLDAGGSSLAVLGRA